MKIIKHSELLDKHIGAPGSDKRISFDAKIAIAADNAEILNKILRLSCKLKIRSFKNDVPNEIVKAIKSLRKLDREYKKMWDEGSTN